MGRSIRNIAIIAHVDHGKTTLVDQLLRQSGAFRDNQQMIERIMDSNDLEKERGITIFSKNCSITYKDIHINIIDTPGHADFGGEVERVLLMVDSVLLLIDAVDGPMPQTRFVTQKALALGLNPIVVVNKIDRQGARPDWAVNQTFDLFDKLGANDQQLDFPVVYASALNGYASIDSTARNGTMDPLFNMIIQHTPPAISNVDAPLQMQISSLDYSSYVGRIGIGKILRGRILPGQQIAMQYGKDGSVKLRRVNQILGFSGLERIQLSEGQAGDIVLLNGIEDISIGVTICSPEKVEPLPVLLIDEPTLTVNICVNTSPLAGKEGKFVTSRQIRERLMRELQSNVALRVLETSDETVFEVSGRGELHLTILIENMRREGYEMGISRPRVIFKTINGVQHEPYELLTIDLEDVHQGGIMEELGRRRAELLDMISDSQGRTRLEYRIPSRGLIGFQSEFMTLTRGTGLMNRIFDKYDLAKEHSINERRNGVLISSENGQSIAYALWKLQDRGRIFVHPGDPIYEGMIIGIHNRDNDLVVNPIKGKQLTNIRASGTDEAIRLIPPICLTLEYAIEFINDDELVEVTPKSIRLRKSHLQEHERRRENRSKKDKE